MQAPKHPNYEFEYNARQVSITPEIVHLDSLFHENVHQSVNKLPCIQPDRCILPTASGGTPFIKISESFFLGKIVICGMNIPDALIEQSITILFLPLSILLFVSSLFCLSHIILLTGE